MTFEDFQKKIEKTTDPDKAYKLYLQVKISILESIIIETNQNITRESLNRIEEAVLNEVIEKFNK